MDWAGVHCDVVTVPVCCGKDGAEHESEAVDLLVNLRLLHSAMVLSCGQ